MTADLCLAGAPLDKPVDWKRINWKKVNRNVKQLQVRIVKAIEAGRWGKVKALQWLLAHSFSGKALAVRRVTENRGKKTAGVDGEIWDTPQKKAKAIQELRQYGYRSQPLRRTYIPKKDGKRTRPLGIPTMYDRAMQALYKLTLDPIAETTGDHNSYGFRQERSPADAIAQCFLCLRQKTSPTAMYEGDIRGCFDNIRHEWLLENIPIDKRILRQWLKAGYIDQKVFHPTEAGTPQGGIISPVLSNLTLDGLEAAIANQPHRGSKRQAKLHLIRFADDYVITGNSQELLEEDIAPGVEEFLDVRGLEVSPEKTRITDLEEGFDFLGQNIRKYKGKLLITPSKQSVKEILEKVREIIAKNPTASAGYLIQQLNPVIRGWVNYHRHVVSKKTFRKIDYVIFQALWRWAKRRHRQKSSHWVRNRYYGQSWQFHAKIKDKHGNRRVVYLYRPADTPIQRHVKVKAEANPYHPAWEHYFEQRLQNKMSHRLQNKPRLLYLWQTQQGICPVCQEKLTEEVKWEQHHLLPRVEGGADTLDNLVLLHPICHRQVHCLGSIGSVAAPCQRALVAA
jgi:RNA-directed DNA polymerase